MENNLILLLIIVYENYAFHCVRASINVRAAVYIYVSICPLLYANRES